MNDLTFRYAEEKDCGLILYFIKELATYEKMLEINETDMAIREAEVEYDAGEKLMDARETLNSLRRKHFG